LKDRNIWCTWKYKSVDGRKAKVPYNPLPDIWPK